MPESTNTSSSNVQAPIQATPSALDNVRVSGVVADQLKNDSPLQLLNGIPTQEGMITDPNQLAQSILAKEHAKANPAPAPKQEEPEISQTQFAVDPMPQTPLKQQANEAHALLESLNKRTTAPIPDYKVAPTVETPPVEAPIESAESILAKALNGEEIPETPVDTKAPVEEEDPLADIPEELPTTKDANGDEVKSAAAENFKKLRKRAQILNNTSKEATAKLAAAEKELQNYKTGLVMPEVIAEKEKEIAELSKYRDMIDLRLSPEYKKTYVAPLNDLGEQLATYAKEYEVPESVMLKALTIKKDAELTRFLSEHFDPAAALDVRGIVKKMSSIQGEALAAQQNPGKALSILQQENEAITKVHEAQRVTNINSSAHDAWIKAIESIEEEGEAEELIWNENDSQHNQSIVQPLRSHAAKEYGKLINRLTKNGLKTLDQEDAHALARATLLAVGSSMAIRSRNSVLRETGELEQNIGHLNAIMRPSIGGSANGTGTLGERESRVPKAAATPMQEGANLLRDIGVYPK